MYLNCLEKLWILKNCSKKVPPRETFTYLKVYAMTKPEHICSSSKAFSEKNTLQFWILSYTLVVWKIGRKLLNIKRSTVLTIYFCRIAVLANQQQLYHYLFTNLFSKVIIILCNRHLFFFTDLNTTAVSRLKVRAAIATKCHMPNLTFISWP